MAMPVYIYNNTICISKHTCCKKNCPKKSRSKLPVRSGRYQHQTTEGIITAVEKIMQTKDQHSFTISFTPTTVMLERGIK